MYPELDEIIRDLEHTAANIEDNLIDIDSAILDLKELSEESKNG